ncbi:MAG: hypothetical protein ABID54_00780 [Pseudomonadota bacterium]
MGKRCLGPIQFLFIPLVFSLLMGEFGCGKKAPPVAPESVAPKAISDLSATVRNGEVFLHWTTPDRNTDGSRLTGLAGFKIFRSKATLDTEPCPDCPKRFKEIADINWRRIRLKKVPLTNNTMKYVDSNLTYPAIYTYKVLSYSSDGIFSEDSNLVEVACDESPPRR